MKQEITSKVSIIQDEINKLNSDDFYIYRFDLTGRLILAGSFDFSYYHNIEIHFIDVSYLSCPGSLFKIERMRLATEIETKEIYKQSYGYNEGIVFCLEHETFQNKFFIVAKDVDFRIETVKYT